MEKTPALPQKTNREFYKAPAKATVKGTVKGALKKAVKAIAKPLGFLPNATPLDVAMSVGTKTLLPGMIGTIAYEGYKNKKFYDDLAIQQAEARKSNKVMDDFNKNPIYKYNLAPRFGESTLSDGSTNAVPVEDKKPPQKKPTPKSTGGSLSNSLPISTEEPDRLKYSRPKEGIKDNPNFMGYKERKILTDFAGGMAGKTPTGVMSMKETMSFIKKSKENKDMVQSYFNKHFNRNQ